MPLQLILCPGRGRYPPVRRHNPRGELDWREPAMRRDDCVGFEVHGSGACDQRQAWLLCGGQPTGTGRGGTGTTASSTRLSSRGFHAVCTPQKAERGGGMCRRAPHRGCRCLQGCARRLAAGLSQAEAPILCRSRPRRGLRRRPHCAPASGSAAALRPPTTFASTPRCTQKSGPRPNQKTSDRCADTMGSGVVARSGGMGSAAERVLNQLHPGLPEPLVLDVLAQAAIPRARVQDAKEA